MLYYCGFDAFLQFKQKPDPSVFLHSLSDLILDNHDKIITAFIGWCSLFLQTGNGQIIYLGYSKNKRQNSITVCSKVPQYIVSIECGAKETFLVTLDSKIYKWSGFNFEKTSPTLVSFENNNDNNNDNSVEEVKPDPEKAITNNHCNHDEPFNVEQLCIGVEYSCLLNDQKQAFLFDINELNLIKPISDKNIIKISAGQEHIVLLTQDGEILTYGNGSRGQLGHGDVQNISEKAEIVEALNGVKCKEIAAGGWHSMALSEIGDVYVWGWNESGQLGLSRDEFKIQAIPTLLDISEDDNFKEISAGSRHSMAVSENGILFGWGWNKYGQLGLNPEQIFFDCPTVIPFDHKVSNVSCKFWSSLIETQNDLDTETN